MGGGILTSGGAREMTVREMLSEMLGRPIPDDEKLTATWSELRLMVAAIKEENEMLNDELDYLKGYPVNGFPKD